MKKILCCIPLILLSAVSLLSVAFAQNNNKGQAEFPREQLQLQLSEEVIAAGQRLWFSAYLSSDSFPPEAKSSKAVYVEILHKSGRQIADSRWPISEGMASGTLSVPDSLSSGWYTIRAYTQWMRNFPEATFCHLPLLVISPYQKKAADMATSVQAVSIFPEGGRLVAGLQSRVVFRINQASVQQSVVSAQVVDQQDSVVAIPARLQHGLGAFDLRPEAGGRYRLQLVTLEKDTINSALPAIQAEGYVMRVKRRQDQFQVEVQGSSHTTDSLRLLLLSAGRILHTQAVLLTDSLWTAQLSSERFRGRQAQLLLLDGSGNMMAKRLVFASHEERQVQLRVQQNSYAPREKVSIHLRFKGSEGIRSSLAVRKVHRLRPSTAAQQRRGADWWHEWLITQQLPSSHTVAILQQSRSAQLYTVEAEGMLLSGTLTDLQGTPLADSVLLFSVPGTVMPGTVMPGMVMPGNAAKSHKPVFDYYRTDARGRFYFPVGNLYGSRESILQLPEHAEGYRVAVDQKFAPPPAGAVFTSLPVPSADEVAEFAADSRKRQEIRQLYGLYEPDTTTAEKASEEDVFRFYGTPNFVKNMDDFISLPTFEEVNRELMPGIRLKKSEEGYRLSVFDVRTRNFLTGKPMLLIDGVAVYDVNRLTSLSPDSITLIETVNRRTYYGEFPFHGTIALYTRSGRGYEPFLSAYAHRETLHFYNHFTSFSEVFPASSAATQARMPDFRTLIYWLPALQPDEQHEAVVEFLHADETGTFEVEVYGMTSAGEPFAESVTYEVKPSTDWQ